MSSYGLNNIRDYLGNKEFKGNEILNFGIMIVLSILLISGGIIIIQDEDIYKKIYKDLSELTDEQLKNHYLFFGINEKRFYKIPDDFDCNIYK